MDSAIAHAELAPKKLGEPLIPVEQDTRVQKFKELLCAMLDSIAILAHTAGDLADFMNFSLAEHWDVGGNDGEAILTILNSQHAQVSRDAWTPSINERNAITFFITELIDGKYGSLIDAIANVKENHAAISEAVLRDHHGPKIRSFFEMDMVALLITHFTNSCC